MKERTLARGLGLGFALVLMLAACGNDSNNSTAGGGSGSESGTASGSASGAGSSVEQVELATGDLGSHLVDQAGMTLYLFTKDSQGQKSVCEGECLAAWPALAGKPKAGSGVDASLIGTIKRSDGSTQATYNGWPLYYYAPDQKPGDTLGQEVQDTWYVVSPQGKAIEGEAGGSSPSSDQRSGY